MHFSPLTLQQYPQFKITETITQSSHIFLNEDDETRFTQSSISSQSFYNFIHSTVPKQHDTKHYKFKVPFLLVHTTNESKSLKKNTPVTMWKTLLSFEANENHYELLLNSIMNQVTRFMYLFRACKTLALALISKTHFPFQLLLQLCHLVTISINHCFFSNAQIKINNTICYD